MFRDRRRAAATKDFVMSRVLEPTTQAEVPTVAAAPMHQPRTRVRAAFIPGPALWFLVDGLAGAVAMWWGYLLSPSFSGVIDPSGRLHMTPADSSFLFGISFALVTHVVGLHWSLTGMRRFVLGLKLFASSAVALAIVGAVVFGVIYSRIGRLILIQALVYAPLLAGLPRLLYWQTAQAHKRRLFVVGDDTARAMLQELIRAHHPPVEIVLTRERHAFAIRDENSLKAITESALSAGADEVIVCGRESEDLAGELVDCLSHGVSVSDLPSFTERYFAQVPVRLIDARWFLNADIEFGHPIYQTLKRMTDVCVAACGLVIAAPLLALVAIAIRLESRGPVLYSHLRVGLFGQPFRIWKLRSMRQNAEAAGAQWAGKADTRVTRVGWLLRRTRLDEVPQFWNILRGEMSLVGPRPERPEFVHELAQKIPFYAERHLVKPGLTGWAQINYPYGASVADAEKKLQYDLYYVKNASVSLDVQIMLRTIGAVMKGAR
jgi:exopolysaccharide biosynthesis polyprenyl glycosylphosphotransferase